MKLRKKHARPSAPPDMRLLTLCICFLIGMLAAWPVHRRIGSEALAQLGAYVQSYAQLAEGRVQQPRVAYCPRRRHTCVVRCWRSCADCTARPERF